MLELAAAVQVVWSRHSHWRARALAWQLMCVLGSPPSARSRAGGRCFVVEWLGLWRDRVLAWQLMCVLGSPPSARSRAGGCCFVVSCNISYVADALLSCPLPGVLLLPHSTASLPQGTVQVLYFGCLGVQGQEDAVNSCKQRPSHQVGYTTSLCASGWCTCMLLWGRHHQRKRVLLGSCIVVSCQH
jgi:hypothetical protein